MSVKLFVGGFPLDMDELELARSIGPHGDISTLKIVRDKKTRICKGYAFVEMVSMADAAAVAAALDGVTMGDRKLKVKLVEAEVAAPPVKTYQKVTRPGEPVKNKRPRRLSS